MDSLADRLVRNPHDEQALANAHARGASDPVAYANLLERVAERTQDSAVACHWLSEAANVWSTSLSDPRRAATLLMHAVERDPTHPLAASRLAQLYRERGDDKALVALLEHRARAYVSLLPQHPHFRNELARMHEDLGELWADKLGNQRKALENFRRAIEVDSSSRLAIYRARELCKDLGQFAEALPLYEAELWLETNLARKAILLRDESGVRRRLGDVPGSLRALEQARDIDPDDDALKQEFSSLVLETLESGQAVPDATRVRATTLLIELAETYAGDHGLAYAGGALDLEPGNDRAFQLFVHHADVGGVTANVAERSRAYLQVNPNGPLAETARARAGIATPAREAARTEIREPAFEDGERPRVNANALQGALRQASELIRAERRDDALNLYLSVLDTDGAHPEALVWVEDELRSRRDYPRLRDVITRAVRAMQGPETLELRKERLREVSSLCELSLRDMNGAVSALKQLLSLDRRDAVARANLVRLLERANRFDDLANLYEQEALAESDITRKIELERLVYDLHKNKRNDALGAAEALERIARILPDNLAHSTEAIDALLMASLWDRALDLIASATSLANSNEDKARLEDARAAALEGRGDASGAGEAHFAAGTLEPSTTRLERAESTFIASELWVRAAQSAVALATLDRDAAASHHYRAAEHWTRASKLDEAIALLEPIVASDERHEAAAKLLAVGYESRERFGDLATMLRTQAQIRGGDAALKLLKKVANTEERHLSVDLARSTWRELLTQHPADREALAWLADDTENNGEHAEASRLVGALRETLDGGERDQAVLLLVRQGNLLERAGDVAAARNIINQLVDLSGATEEWLAKLAQLSTKLEDHDGVAKALSATIEHGYGGRETRQFLSETLEKLGDYAGALQALGDAHEFEDGWILRATGLARAAQDDATLAILLQRQLDSSEAILELAATLSRLNLTDDAFALLGNAGASGDSAIRSAYSELGDRLGWSGIVGNQIVAWWRTSPDSQDRFDQLSSAVERWLKMSRTADALALGTHLLSSRYSTRVLADKVEELAEQAHDYDTLGVAHDWKLAQTESSERPAEYVRQAEVRSALGGGEEALSHGELGLTHQPWAIAKPLIDRLGKLPGASFTLLMQRQLERSQPSERLVVAVEWAARTYASGDHPQAKRIVDDAVLNAIPQARLELAIAQALESPYSADTQNAVARLVLTRFVRVASEDASDRDMSRALTTAASLAFSKLGDLEQSSILISRAIALDPTDEAIGVLDAVTPSNGDAAVLAKRAAEEAEDVRARQKLLLVAYDRFLAASLRDEASEILEARYHLAPHDTTVEQDLCEDLERRGEGARLIALLERQLMRQREGEVRNNLARRVAQLRSTTTELQDAIEAWRRVNRYLPGDEEAAREIERLRNALQAAREIEAAKDSGADAAIAARVPSVQSLATTIEDADDALVLEASDDDLLEEVVDQDSPPSATIMMETVPRSMFDPGATAASSPPPRSFHTPVPPTRELQPSLELLRKATDSLAPSDPQATLRAVLPTRPAPADDSVDLIDADEAYDEEVTPEGSQLDDLDLTRNVSSEALLVAAGESAPALDLDEDELVMVDDVSDVGARVLEEVRPRSSVPPPLPRT